MNIQEGDLAAGETVCYVAFQDVPISEALPCMCLDKFGDNAFSPVLMLWQALYMEELDLL